MEDEKISLKGTHGREDGVRTMKPFDPLRQGGHPCSLLHGYPPPYLCISIGRPMLLTPTCAPALRSSRMHSPSPLVMAALKGVFPEVVALLGSAFWARRSFMIARFPASAAAMRGVTPNALPSSAPADIAHKADAASKSPALIASMRSWALDMESYTSSMLTSRWLLLNLDSGTSIKTVDTSQRKARLPRPR